MSCRFFNKDIEEIHSIEGNEELLNFHIDGIPLWSFSRGEILEFLYERMINVRYGFDNLEKDSKRKNRYLLKQNMHRVFHMVKGIPYLFQPKSPSLFWMSTSFAGTRSDKVLDGKIYDFLQSPIGNHLGKRCTVFEKHDEKMVLSSKGEFSVSVLPPINYIGNIFDLFLSKVGISEDRSRYGSEFSSFVIDLIKKKFHLHLEENDIKRMMSISRFASNKIKYRRQLWRKFLSRMKPRVLSIGCGMYGFEDLISAAHDCGIIVCESQHGIIYEGHITYTHNDIVSKNNMYKYCKPDYFLSYGDYWNNSIRIPSKTITIGNPYFSIVSKDSVEICGDKILFLLGDHYYYWINIIKSISLSFPGRVVVRPHPGIRDKVIKSQVFSLLGIEVDCNLNLYDTLKLSSVIVGDISTSLYEAAALGRRIFFDGNNPLADNFPFQKFYTVDELEAGINSSSMGLLPENIRNSFFAQDWEGKFDNFINEVI